MKTELHKPIQREDGSVYCYCHELKDEKISCSVNYKTKKLICSVCGKEMDSPEMEKTKKKGYRTFAIKDHEITGIIDTSQPYEEDIEETAKNFGFDGFIYMSPKTALALLQVRDLEFKKKEETNTH